MHWQLEEGQGPTRALLARRYLAGALLQETVAAGWGLGKAVGEEGLRLVAVGVAAVGMAAGAGVMPWGSGEEGCTLAKGAGLPELGWVQGCRLEWV